MMRTRSRLASALSGACLVMLLACQSNVNEEQQETTRYREQGLGESGRLSKAEWATFMADQRYVNGLTSPGVRIRLNMADQKQHRFAMARLKLAGKTPLNSPYLFEALEKRRQLHLAKGYQPGLLPEEEVQALSTAERTEMHFIETASAGETTPAANDGMGTASSAFPGGAPYSYLDTTYTDPTGYPLGELAWVEEFSGGYSVSVSAAGDLSRTSLKEYLIASYKVEEKPDGTITDSYIYTKIGKAGGPAVAEVPRLSAPTVVAPADIAFGDNLISVCLNRTWTQDCDYDLTGTPTAFKLPLKGSISILSGHTFDQATINQVKTDENNGVSRPDAGSIKVILTNVGGGCNVTDVNKIAAKMAPFWNRVTLDATKKTFSWDLTGAQALIFDDSCRQVQNEVKLTAIITLFLIAPDGTKYRSSMTLSSPGGGRPDHIFKKITVTNSCLAAGTEIELASGQSSAIESLKAGDQVVNPYAPSLTIMDTAVGFETVPMVRIRSEAGRSLLMTEMHPIQVATRGMVQARSLKQGDVVMTKAGPSKLVEVSREAYDGKVYNVKVGSGAEQASLAEDQTALYANGFLVGDGQIQSKYEALEMTRKGDVLARLPSRWHRDYEMSPKRR